MSTPTSTCFLTMSATAVRARAAKASASTGSPASRFWIMSIRSGGRGRLPVWVVKIRSLLRCIVPSLVHARPDHGSLVEPDLVALVAVGDRQLPGAERGVGPGAVHELVAPQRGGR